MTDIPEVQDAVSRVPGVTAATVRWPDPLGPATLRVEFAGADAESVTRAVVETLRDVGGVEPEQIALELPARGPGNDGPAAAPAAAARLRRPVFSGMTVDRGDLDSTVEVTLQYGERRLTGRAVGLATRTAATRTAAAAALDALRDLLPPDVRVQVEWLEVVDPTAPGRHQLVQAAVTVLSRRGEEVYLGTAFVRGDLREAAVRATLDAVNRRLELQLRS